MGYGVVPLFPFSLASRPASPAPHCAFPLPRPALSVWCPHPRMSERRSSCIAGEITVTPPGPGARPSPGAAISDRPSALLVSKTRSVSAWSHRARPFSASVASAHRSALLVAKTRSVSTSLRRPRWTTAAPTSNRPRSLLFPKTHPATTRPDAAVCPKGAASSSPRLAPRAYLGYPAPDGPNPIGVASRVKSAFSQLRRSRRNNPNSPRVSRASRSRALPPSPVAAESAFEHSTDPVAANVRRLKSLYGLAVFACRVSLLTSAATIFQSRSETARTPTAT
jgi:hypothetical protein